MRASISVAIAFVAASIVGVAQVPARAAEPNEREAIAAIKEAMARGVHKAIVQLGRPDGFLRDDAVKIGLPKHLAVVADDACSIGESRYVDDLELSINRAAERAVPAAAELFADAVRQMTIVDAAILVAGPADAATQYFRRVSQDRIRARFRPVVSAATAETCVAAKLEALIGTRGETARLCGGPTQGLDGYITDKALDGIFHYVGQTESEIRRNPVGQGSWLLARVFSR
jgi:hypothetical protein